MSDLILIYITCDSVKQAKDIGTYLLKKHLCGCINIFPQMKPIFFWPPKSEKLDESKEVVLLVKTIEGKYKEIEREIYKIHTYDTPCIIVIPVRHVGKKYYDWIRSEIR